MALGRCDMLLQYLQSITASTLCIFNHFCLILRRFVSSEPLHFDFSWSDFVVEVLRWKHSVYFPTWGSISEPWKDSFSILAYLTTATLIGGKPNMKSVYIYMKWKIVIMPKLHQAHSIVYSFLKFLVCMIVYHFLGFGSVIVFSCLGINLLCSCGSQ